MTAHIEATKEQIAKTVIMPGDPKRAEYIAKTYLKNYECINTVRGMLGFTGYFNDKRVTVMASGMGMPSIGIYSYELFKFYDVDNIIRIGSAGSYDKDINIYDVVLVTESYSDSHFAKTQNGFDGHIIKSDDELNQKLKDAASKLNIKLHQGTIYSSDVFYKEQDNYQILHDEYHCLGVEMESFALFHNANVLHKKAACLLTISDSIITNEQTTSEEREKSFHQMMEIALNAL